MKVDLVDAVSHISRTLSTRNENDPLPYFFICGAGISVPEIPLAKGIIETCKKKIAFEDPRIFKNNEAKIEKEMLNSIDEYSTWVQAAYPNKIDRSSYFKSLSKKSRISSANLRLAQILQSRKVASTVFTTNFDDMIRRALSLIGEKDFFISENTMDNLVVNANDTEIQVVHVHGTYNFYNCANLSNEIADVSCQTGTISSSQVLTSFLHSSTPIIIGYSGWETDVIMTCLKKRLEHPVPRNYIWVCYRQDDYQKLPTWLTDNENIIFVMPDKCVEDSNNDLKGIDTTAYSENNKTLETLDATRVFRALISSIKINTPTIFINPFIYFSSMIDRELPKDEDVLHLRHWAQRMQVHGATESSFEKLIKQFEKASTIKDYSKAKKILEQICKEQLTLADIEFVNACLFADFYSCSNVKQTIDSITAFFNSVLDFIEMHFPNSLKVSAVETTLQGILYYHYNHKSDEDISKEVSIVNRIIEISKLHKSFKDFELTSLGIKAGYVDDDKDAKSLLQELLARCPKRTKSKRLNYIQCQALIDISRYQPIEDAIISIQNAEKIDANIKHDLLHIRLLFRKSELLAQPIGDSILKKWISEIYLFIQSSHNPPGHLQIMALVNNLFAAIRKYDMETPEILSFLAKFIEEQPSIYADDDITISYASICLNFAYAIDDTDVKASYLRKIYNSIRPSSLSEPTLLQMMLYAIRLFCDIPIHTVSDSEKIEKLLVIKKEMGKLENPSGAAQENYYDAIQNAINQSREQKYIDAGLSIDIEKMKIRQNIRTGFDAYLKGEYEKAETLFTEAMSCGIEYVEQQALINISFMVRRKETTNLELSFEDIIEQITVIDSVKLMNIILYYKQNKHMDSPNYLNAINSLAELDTDELDRAFECWENIDLVGEEESKIALEVLSEVCSH